MTTWNLCRIALKAGAVTKTDLAAELSAVPESSWITSQYPDQAGTIVWLPLVRISATGIWLGLDRRGVWTLGRLEGAVESSEKNLPSSWVTMLDSDEKSIRAELNITAERFGVSPSILQDLLPIEGVLSMALRSRSDHWIERALSWLSNRDLSREHLELLREVSMTAWVNQRTRHAARRLARAAEE
ncbi:hypothetical protein ACFV20_30670 [Streptomyces sp. NPDC059696]|uniref:hypothetical protein n=1 Tax=Streptomyces sp. NPDC059696 TaxID=3346911 RepID=UPI0036C4306F